MLLTDCLRSRVLNFASSFPQHPTSNKPRRYRTCSSELQILFLSLPLAHVPAQALLMTPNPRLNYVRACSQSLQVQQHLHRSCNAIAIAAIASRDGKSRRAAKTAFAASSHCPCRVESALFSLYGHELIMMFAGA
jgi:hypothetical protein